MQTACRFWPPPGERPASHPRALPRAGLATLLALTAYAIAFLWLESEVALLILVLGGALAVLVAGRLGWLARAGDDLAHHPGLLNRGALVAVLIIAAVFYRDHFTLLMIATVLLYALAALGLNIQFGYAGVLNFSGAMRKVLQMCSAAVRAVGPVGWFPPSS